MLEKKMDLLEPINPFTLEFTQFPESQIGKWREVEPVTYLEAIGAWIATSYEHNKTFLNHPNFTQDMLDWEMYQSPGEEDPYPTLTKISEESPFLGELHGVTRRVLANTFTPRAIRRIDDQIREVVSEFSGPLTKGGVVDVFKDFTCYVPNTVISRIIGIPPMGEEENAFRDMAVQVLRYTNPMISPEERKLADEAAESLMAKLGAMIAERKENPGEDLISDLLAAANDIPEITEEHIALIILALLSAGSDTAAQGINFAVKNLMQHPDQLAKLREDRSLMDNAIKELLRYDNPGKFVPRFCIEDTVVNGKHIRKGQAVFLSLQAANWDPAEFDEPSKLDIERDTHKTLSFGHGPHFCVGAHLAKTEIGCMLNLILDNTGPDAKVLDDQIVWDEENLVFRTIESLPLDMGK